MAKRPPRMVDIIPFSKVSIDEREEQAVLEVLRSGWWTQGPKVKEFEEKFAEYVGAKYAVAVNSCTSALFLALKSLQISQGREIYVPSLTFTASAATIVHAGFRPVFCDINPDTFIPGPHRRAGCAAQVIVNYSGVNVRPGSLPTDVVDSAHLVERNMCQHSPSIFCFSFYPTKNLASAEGGMICTNDEETAAWLRLARSHGQTRDNFQRYAVGGPSNWEYSIEFPGWKMNMTDFQAAIGLVQLEKLDEMNAKRQKIVDRYNEAFRMNRKGLHLYPIEVPDRDEFMQQMDELGIQCSVHFLPLHNMPAYKKYPRDPLTNTRRLGETLVSLPLWPDMTEEQINRVIEGVKQCL